MTLGEFVVHWQKYWDRQHSRPSTYAAHGYLLKNHILPGLGDASLSDLTEKRIGEFLEERRRFGGHRPEKSEYPGLGEETMRHIQTLLQQILEHAVHEGLMKENPARPFYRRRSKTVKAEPLTPLEVEDYLDAAEQLGYLPLFLLALTAGLRQRELIALQWSDLDVKRYTLTIDEGRSVVNRTLVKYSGDIRTSPLTEEVTELLVHEHSQHPNSPWMFVNPSTQRPLSPKVLRRMHGEIIQRAGLDHVRFTDLRHTCAVNALKNGMEVRELSRMLGHAKTTTTRWDYGSYLPQSELKREAQRTTPELDELKQASIQMENLFEF